jgi:hypothetical protein
VRALHPPPLGAQVAALRRACAVPERRPAPLTNAAVLRGESLPYLLHPTLPVALTLHSRP